MLTTRGWRVSPTGSFCMMVLAVMVFLLSHPAWDSATSPSSASHLSPAHSRHIDPAPVRLIAVEHTRRTR